MQKKPFKKIAVSKFVGMRVMGLAGVSNGPDLDGDGNTIWLANVKK